MVRSKFILKGFLGASLGMMLSSMATSALAQSGEIKIG